jgi:hypothetical protein
MNVITTVSHSLGHSISGRAWRTSGPASHPVVLRVLLLLAGPLIVAPVHLRAQVAGPDVVGKTLSMPNTEMHRLTAANGRTYTLYVHLPATYTTSDATTYPVLYLTDAELEVMAMYIGITNFLRITNRIDDVILVGIADGNIDVHRGLRRLDYTPTRSVADTAETATSGGADTFLDFVRDRAMPLIEDRYRTDPGDRGLWGYSFGGTLAAHALLNRPGTFQRYLLASPALHWDDRLLVKQAKAYGAAHGDLPALAHTGYGADESAANIAIWRAFIDELTSPRYPGLVLTTELVPDADHTTAMPIAFMRGMVAVYGLRPTGIDQTR